MVSHSNLNVGLNLSRVYEIPSILDDHSWGHFFHITIFVTLLNWSQWTTHIIWDACGRSLQFGVLSFLTLLGLLLLSTLNVVADILSSNRHVFTLNNMHKNLALLDVVVADRLAFFYNWLEFTTILEKTIENTNEWICVIKFDFLNHSFVLIIL